VPTTLAGLRDFAGNAGSTKCSGSSASMKRRTRASWVVKHSAHGRAAHGSSRCSSLRYRNVNARIFLTSWSAGRTASSCARNEHVDPDHVVVG
jgi:hypothetical protein